MGSLAFEIFAEAVSGGCGGFFSSVVLFPLDLLKTKAQSGGKGVGTIELCKRVWNKNIEGYNTGFGKLMAGVLGFFRDSHWRGIQSFCEKFGYFYCYALLRSAYTRYFQVLNVDPLSNLVVGYCAEWMHAPVTMPIDCCVCRVITKRQSMFKVRPPKFTQVRRS